MVAVCFHFVPKRHRGTLVAESTWLPCVPITYLNDTQAYSWQGRHGCRVFPILTKWKFGTLVNRSVWLQWVPFTNFNDTFAHSWQGRHGCSVSPLRTLTTPMHIREGVDNVAVCHHYVHKRRLGTLESGSAWLLCVTIAYPKDTLARSWLGRHGCSVSPLRTLTTPRHIRGGIDMTVFPLRTLVKGSLL